jgi:hypothetical protein
MKKFHVASCMGHGRHVASVHTWHGDVAGRRHGRVTIQVNDMVQCLVVTWPSHGMPCGSGKIPNEGR